MVDISEGLCGVSLTLRIFSHWGVWVVRECFMSYKWEEKEMILLNRRQAKPEVKV